MTKCFMIDLGKERLFLFQIDLPKLKVEIFFNSSNPCSLCEGTDFAGDKLKGWIHVN